MLIIKSIKLLNYNTNNQKNYVLVYIFLSEHKFRFYGVTTKKIPGGPIHATELPSFFLPISALFHLIPSL